MSQPVEGHSALPEELWNATTNLNHYSQRANVLIPSTDTEPRNVSDQNPADAAVSSSDQGMIEILIIAKKQDNSNNSTAELRLDIKKLPSGRSRAERRAGKTTLQLKFRGVEVDEDDRDLKKTSYKLPLESKVLCTLGRYITKYSSSVPLIKLTLAPPAETVRVELRKQLLPLVTLVRGLGQVRIAGLDSDHYKTLMGQLFTSVLPKLVDDFVIWLSEATEFVSYMYDQSLEQGEHAYAEVDQVCEMFGLPPDQDKTNPMANRAKYLWCKLHLLALTRRNAAWESEYTPGVTLQHLISQASLLSTRADMAMDFVGLHGADRYCVHVEAGKAKWRISQLMDRHHRSTSLCNRKDLWESAYEQLYAARRMPRRYSTEEGRRLLRLVFEKVDEYDLVEFEPRMTISDAGPVREYILHSVRTGWEDALYDGKQWLGVYKLRAMADVPQVYPHDWTVFVSQWGC